MVSCNGRPNQNIRGKVMSTSNLRGTEETVDTETSEGDPSLITATQVGDKRGLDVVIQADMAAKNEVIPLLFQISELLMHIRNQLEFITDEKGF